MFRKALLVFVLAVLLAGCSQPASQTATPQAAAAETAEQPATITTEVPAPAAETPAATATPAETPEMTMPEGEMHAMPEIGRTEPASPTQAAAPEFGHDHLMEGPHIRLAPAASPSPEDEQRAAEIARTARQALAKYEDYKAALDDGYEIFVPEVPQEVYHFINYREAYRNYTSLDPAKPTALLYRKTGDGYEWVGVMYSAPMPATTEELDRRFPTSMAQWHAHVNVCLPLQGMNVKDVLAGGEFGFEGAITTQADCQKAGGRFMPDVFGWMVHVMFDPSPQAGQTSHNFGKIPQNLSMDS